MLGRFRNPRNYSISYSPISTLVILAYISASIRSNFLGEPEMAYVFSYFSYSSFCSWSLKISQASLTLIIKLLLCLKLFLRIGYCSELTMLREDSKYFSFYSHFELFRYFDRT